MRKAIVGLMVAGLMAAAAPATAQVPGSQDPLSLITSGFIVPYVGADSNSESWLELYAPFSGVTVHAFFYNTTCVRQGDSVGIELTENDAELVRIDNLGNTPTTGLMTAAGVDASGFILQPLENPVHARVLWVNVNDGFVRTLEPISASTADNDFGNGFTLGTGTWNPLRTGAVFFAPPEVGGVTTRLLLVCPNQNIIGDVGTTSSTTRAFGPASGFPELFPTARAVGATTPLRVRVYDDEENFLRDVTTTCDCLTDKSVLDISAVYADTVRAPAGTYTEIEGATANAQPAVCSTTEIVPVPSPGTPNPGNPCPLNDNGDGQFRLITPAINGGGPFAFTGYRAVRVAGFDIFGRLSNGSRSQIQGSALFDSGSNGR
jgi:hypothetical protein